MAPFATEAAKRNLQKGIRKMESSMTPAAQVRRDFRLGRAPKAIAGECVPLHPVIVWQRAIAALADFRTRMAAANLNPKDVHGFVVAVGLPNFDNLRILSLDGKRGGPDYYQTALMEDLGAGRIALGMVFQQRDHNAGEWPLVSTFPYPFAGINKKGVTGLCNAAIWLNDKVIELQQRSRQ